MAMQETKVVLVATGGMNRKINKLNAQGWRVISTSSAGMPGYMHITLERPKPSSSPTRKPEVKRSERPTPSFTQANRDAAEKKRREKAEKAEARKAQRQADRAVKRIEVKQRKAERSAAKQASKNFPPEPWV